MSNGGKFKLYTVLNGLIFPKPIQPRISHNLNFYIMINDIFHPRSKVYSWEHTNLYVIKKKLSSLSFVVVIINHDICDHV
jgi:hypothetical protein